jgi:hypothetical protein
MEPAYPGALGHYINLGTFYDRKKLRPFAEKLIDLKNQNQACYTRAYQCLRAAQEVRKNGEKVFLTSMAKEKAAKRANGILSREIKGKRGKRGKETKRFIGGITCQGLLCLYETVQTQCKRIYELQDSCAIANLLLQELKEGILAAGYDIILFPAPEDPSRLEHLIVPELSLGFVTTRPNQVLEKRPYRRIRMESMADKEVLKRNRAKLRFAYRIANELTEDGIKELKQAKAIHDEMEAIYHPFVNFSGVNKMTKALIEEIEELP